MSTPARDSAAGAGVPGGPAAAVSAWNIANVLTVLRLALVPVFLVLLFADGGHHAGWRTAAFAAFVVAAVTDLVDGELARSRGLVTDVGKLLDPIADKALIGGALVGLSLLGELWWWVTITVLAREAGVTGLRFWVIRHGVIAASRGGKLKTLLQSLAIGLLVLPLPDPGHALGLVVMMAAVVVTVVTGAEYVVTALRLRRRGIARGRRARS